MWDLQTVLSTYEVKLSRRSRLVCTLFCFALLRTEDLRCCVLSTSACLSLLFYTSSVHLLTSRKCFPHFTNTVSTHTVIRSIPIILCPHPADGAMQGDEKLVITSICSVWLYCWLDCVVLIQRQVWFPVERCFHRHPVTQEQCDAPPTELLMETTYTIDLQKGDIIALWESLNMQKGIRAGVIGG